MKKACGRSTLTTRAQSKTLVDCNEGTLPRSYKRLAPFVRDSGTDHTGMGRWSWYLLECAHGHKKRVITAYAPCGDANSGKFTVYSQHMNYIRKKGISTNPKAMFCDDLLSALRIIRRCVLTGPVRIYYFQSQLITQ